MSRSTEQLLPGMIPPREERSEEKEVDFLGVLVCEAGDAFGRCAFRICPQGSVCDGSGSGRTKEECIGLAGSGSCQAGGGSAPDGEDQPGRG